MCAVPSVWGLPAQSPVNIEFDGLVYSEDDARIRVEELREEAENLEKMLQKRLPPGTCTTTPNYKVKITIAGREYSTQNSGNPSIRVEFKIYSNYRNETSFPPVRRHYINVFPKDAAGINRFRTFDFSEFTLTEDPDNLNDYLHYHFSLSDYDTTADAFKAATEFGLTLATLTARAIQEFGYTASVDIAEMKNVSNVCWTWMFPLLDFTNTSEMKDIKIYSTDSELLERITELENELTDCRQDYADLMSAFDPGDCPECPVPAECPEIPECPDCVLDTTTIISELRGDFDRLEGSVNGSVGRMRQTISTQEGTIGSQSTTITNQATTIAGLNAAISERNATIASLNAEIATAGGDLTALVAERDALVIERDALITERDTLQGQLDSANGTITTQTATIATLSSDADAAADVIAEQAEEITTQTGTINNIYDLFRPHYKWPTAGSYRVHSGYQTMQKWYAGGGKIWVYIDPDAPTAKTVTYYWQTSGSWEYFKPRTTIDQTTATKGWHYIGDYPPYTSIAMYPADGYTAAAFAKP